MSTDKTISRRGLLMKMGSIQRLVVTALAVPIVRILLSSVTRGPRESLSSWDRSEPSANSRKERRVSPRSESVCDATDGKTADTACWVRRIEGEHFRFSPSIAHISAARALVPRSPGCSLCPCHGGAYYKMGHAPPPAGAWIVRVSAQNTGRLGLDPSG